MKKRILLKAATYRKFWFKSENDLKEYMAGGHLYRHLVSVEYFDKGSIIAIIAEQYNGSDMLIMEKEVKA